MELIPVCLIHTLSFSSHSQLFLEQIDPTDSFMTALFFSLLIYSEPRGVKQPTSYR